MLANIDLTTGALTDLGAIGGGGIIGLALQQPGRDAVHRAVGRRHAADALLECGARSTATSVAITGVAAGETLVGIDYRPQTGQLFALGVTTTPTTPRSTYSIRRPARRRRWARRARSRSSTRAGAAVDLPAASAGYGFDFNPTVDRIRVTTSSAG